MIFNSIDFAWFLPVVLLLYWLAGKKSLALQNTLIVASSYLFYGWWDWRFLLLIFLSTLVDYVIGLSLATQRSNPKRKALLWLSLLVNLGMLGFFKYFDFFLVNFTTAFEFFGLPISPIGLEIVLPVGISFYTFQTLSYTLDVYRRKLKPTKDFIVFSAYVSFFPQLVAGPIERATHLLPQFDSKRTFDYSSAVQGMYQILWGLFKKVVIADRLAIVVNEVFNHPNEYHGFTLLVGTVFFAFQIYCDFSGYSQIARGTARLFGFDLMKNFNTPYFSSSLGEFWRRWHISLSTWFRDYVYIPLGGNQSSKLRWCFNILLVFVISGLWHGARWTFIIWGAIHGVMVVLESLLGGVKLPKNLAIKAFKITTTFVVVCFGWIFFRANTLGDAFYILKDLANGSNYHLSQLSFYLIPVSKNTVFGVDVFLSVFFVVVLVLFEALKGEERLKHAKYIYRLSFCVLSIWTIFLFGAFDRTEFIYFQF